MNKLFLGLIGCLIVTCLACSSLPEPKTVRTEPEQKIDNLIAQLGAKDWQEREQAQKELEEIGTTALDALSTAVETSTDPEIKIRAKKAIKDIQWLERIYNLPKTFDERYYTWVKGTDIIGYMHLKIEDAEYEKQPVFKVTSKWISNDMIEGEMHLTAYTQKNKYLSPIYEEAKIASSEANCDFNMKVKDGRGSVTLNVTKLGITVPFNQVVDIPENTITWETGFMWATALPMDENETFPYTIFYLCPVHGFEMLSTTPVRFIGEDAISYKGNKIKCNKFTGTVSECEVCGWLDSSRNALKINAQGYSYQFILTSREDAFKIFNIPNNGK
ncbi:MAG: hypothetical protein HY811_11980 [Planctomycetes bacterium]|nr:hypothetical protein [Planctomycetota bacterium]